jgi:hypothetical protein
VTGDRRKAPNAYIRWSRIKPDWESGLPPRECARIENLKRDSEGERRRIKPHQISTQAYVADWKRKWQNTPPLTA